METNGSWSQYQKLVLKLLEQHDSKLEELQTRISVSGEDRAVLARDITDLKENVLILQQLVRDGAKSTPSLIARVSHLEIDVEDLQKSEDLRLVKEKEYIAFKRGLIVSLIIASSSIIVNIINILKELVK